MSLSVRKSLLLGIACLLEVTGCAQERNVRTEPRAIASIGGKTEVIVSGEPGSSIASSVPDYPGDTPRDSKISGRVVDDHGRPVPDARVRLAIGGAKGGRVEDVKADSSGAFTLHRLKPGSNYVVIAEAEDGGERLVGRVQARAPQSSLKIRMLPRSDGSSHFRTSSNSGRAKVGRASEVDERFDEDPDESSPRSSRLNREDFEPPAPEADLLDQHTFDTREVDISDDPEEVVIDDRDGSGKSRASATRRSNSEPSRSIRRSRRPANSRPKFEYEDDGENPLPPAIETDISDDRAEVVPSSSRRTWTSAGFVGEHGVTEPSANPTRHESIAIDRSGRADAGERSTSHHVSRKIDSDVTVASATRSVRPADSTNPIAWPDEHEPNQMVQPPFPITWPDEPESNVPPRQAADSSSMITWPDESELNVPPRQAVSTKQPRSTRRFHQDLPRPAEPPLPTNHGKDLFEIVDSPRERSKIASDRTRRSTKNGLTRADHEPGTDENLKRASQVTWGEIARNRIVPLDESLRKKLSNSGADASAVDTQSPMPSAKGNERTLGEAPRPERKRSKGGSGPVAVSCRYDAATRRMHDFELPDAAGAPISLKDYDSDLILLDFWGTWCAPCKTSIPHLIELQNRYGRDRLQVIGIACERLPSDKRADLVAKTQRELGINYPVGITGKDDACALQEALQIQFYPTMILLNRQGQIILRQQGATETTLMRLERAIETALIKK
jgi:thiol-disulfide isomerase/thioredoxin